MAPLPASAPADWLLFTRRARRLALLKLRSSRGWDSSPWAGGAHAQRQPAAYPRRPDPPAPRAVFALHAYFTYRLSAAGFFRTPTAWIEPRLHTFLRKSLPGRVFRYANRVRPDHPPVATLQLPFLPRSRRGLAARRRRRGEGLQVSPASHRAPTSSLSATRTPTRSPRPRERRCCRLAWSRARTGARGHRVLPARQGATGGSAEEKREGCGRPLPRTGGTVWHYSTCPRLLRTSAKGTAARLGTRGRPAGARRRVTALPARSCQRYAAPWDGAERSVPLVKREGARGAALSRGSARCGAGTSAARCDTCGLWRSVIEGNLALRP